MVLPDQLPAELPPPPADPPELPSATPNPVYLKSKYWASDSLLSHQTGEAQGQVWSAIQGKSAAGFLTYGPYQASPDFGKRKVLFKLKSLNLRNAAPTTVVLYLDVYSATQQKVLASRNILAREFPTSQEIYEFPLAFIDNGNEMLEFRVFWHGQNDVQHLETHFNNLDEGALGKAWTGEKNFVTQNQIRPSWWVTEGSTWHLYDRDYSTTIFQNVNEADAKVLCQYDRAGVFYFSTKDNGKTFEPGKNVLRPSFKAGDPHACAILDGTTFFDAESAKWHMMTQCLSNDVRWRLCHFTAPAADGPWQHHPDHVVNRSIWPHLCAGEDKSCATNTYDEGTPDFLMKKNGYFYFTFHGYNGVNGFRGAARTKDFLSWDIEGPGLPGDAIFSTKDCIKDDPGCIGGGHASLLKSGDYYYMLIETPDKNLMCTAGQKWPFQLFRSLEISRSGAWEKFDSGYFLPDPYMISGTSSPSGCGLQYARFLEVGSDIFLQYVDIKGQTTYLQKLNP